MKSAAALIQTNEVALVETWQTNEAGRHLQTLLDAVRRGEWQLVGEGARVEAVLADATELADLLGAGYRFRPKATFGAQGAAIWLPEVGLHVEGATLDEAREALAEALMGFARDWDQHRRHAADLTFQAGYARRIQLAADASGVLAMLDRDAEAEGVAPQSPRPVPEPDETKTRRWMGPRDRIAQVREAQSREPESD